MLNYQTGIGKIIGHAWDVTPHEYTYHVDDLEQAISDSVAEIIIGDKLTYFSEIIECESTEEDLAITSQKLIPDTLFNGTVNYSRGDFTPNNKPQTGF